MEAKQSKELIHCFPLAEGVQLLPGKQDLMSCNIVEHNVVWHGKSLQSSGSSVLVVSHLSFLCTLRLFADGAE